MSFKVTQRDGSGRDSAVFSVAVTPLVNGTLDANAVHPRSGSGGETRVNVKVLFLYNILGKIWVDARSFRRPANHNQRIGPNSSEMFSYPQDIQRVFPQV